LFYEVRQHRLSNATQAKPESHTPYDATQPLGMSKWDPGQTRHEVQTDPHDHQSDPAYELHVAMDVDKTAQTAPDGKAKAEDKRHMRPKRQPDAEGRHQRGPDKAW
jgi:hypothetical protein